MSETTDDQTVPRGSDKTRALLSAIRGRPQSRIIAGGIVAALGTFLIAGPALVPLGVGFGAFQIGCLGEDCPELWSIMASIPMLGRWILFSLSIGILIFLNFLGASRWLRIRTKKEALLTALTGSASLAGAVILTGQRGSIIGSLAFYFMAAVAGALVATTSTQEVVT